MAAHPLWMVWGLRREVWLQGQHLSERPNRPISDLRFNLTDPGIPRVCQGKFPVINGRFDLSVRVGGREETTLTLVFEGLIGSKFRANVTKFALHKALK
jgi:hypothetical protein